MPVLSCSTPGCERFISQSFIPGGSPVALADPERWSLFGFGCRSCGTLLCDRCSTRNVGACACGQSLALSVMPADRDPSDCEAAVDAPTTRDATEERARAFASAVAGLVGCEVVEYSTVDFGRERKAGQRTLLIDRNGQPEGERGIALVRHLRKMGLPPGVQLFANALRSLSDDPERMGFDQVVVLASDDPFEAIRVAEVDPANYDLTAEDVVDRLEDWHRRFGVDVIAADTETVVLRFLRLPSDLAELTAEIVEFCPDLEETFERDPQALAKSTWIWLWWD